MNILNLISKNIFHHPFTRTPDQPVDYPEGLRGELTHHVEICTACGTCAYVCSPSAIVIDRSNPDKAVWEYTLLQCTLCGRCVEFCPTRALSFEDHPARPVYSVTINHHIIEYQKCSRCGNPVIPLPQLVLEKLYGDVPMEIGKLNNLCENCRKKHHSAAIKQGLTGKWSE